MPVLNEQRTPFRADLGGGLIIEGEIITGTFELDMRKVFEDIARMYGATRHASA